MKEKCYVLISSVLHILTHQPASPKLASKEVERFDPFSGEKVRFQPDVVQSVVREVQHDQVVSMGLERPILPEFPEQHNLPGQRGFDDFMRALDNVKEKKSPKVLDLFQ